ncbi:hypothetical protein HYS84_00415 [Candidatus Saccharibacteria bacterium]|nr:hypothetical protein [Candidatus Saccharibacteria bacterium]
MDFEGLKVKTAEKEKQDERWFKSKMIEGYGIIIQQFGELATLLQSSEINLGEMESTIHQPSGMAIAQIEVGNRHGLLAFGGVGPESNFTVHYSLRSIDSMLRFPVIDEVFGIDSRYWQDREHWDSWDIAAVDGMVGTMLEEAPKTLAMLIEAAKDPDLNDPELAERVRRHYEERDLQEAI